MQKHLSTKRDNAGYTQPIRYNSSNQSGAQRFYKLKLKLQMSVCVFILMCTVSIPNAFIWSALFSAMVKNFFGSDRASTIAKTQGKRRFFDKLDWIMLCQVYNEQLSEYPL